MRLLSIKYSQYEGNPAEWKLQKFSLHEANLFVGRNASGKSRILNIIANMAQMLAGRHGPRSGQARYEVKFELDGKEIEYSIRYGKEKVTFEKLSIAGDVRLRRGKGGYGTIYSEEIGKLVKFHTPDSALAVVARRDRVQHNYLEPIYEWANSLSHYHFGMGMGRQNLAIVREGSPEADLRNPDNVLAIYLKGIERYKKKFNRSIIKDMTAVGYPVTDVGTLVPTSIQISGASQGELKVMYVQETDLETPTDQVEMSQGMFRTLSILIHLNFGVFSDTHSTVLIDDIGEGIDFERTSNLVNLLIEKTKANKVQLLMTTNDRFIMNAVPLDYWCLIKRTPGNAKIYNTLNSKTRFEDFKFTGLNNFDFFASEFIE